MKRSAAFEAARAAVNALLEDLDDEGYTGGVLLEFGQGVAHAHGRVGPRKRLQTRILERTDSDRLNARTA